MRNKSTYLVTGCSGFIGSYVVAALQRRGGTVVGLDRERLSWSDPDRFVRRDLLDDEPLSPVLEGVDVVCHLAAAKDDWGISRTEYFRDNVEASRRLLEAGREAGIQNWLFFSTVGVLGPSQRPLGEDAPYAPHTPYASSKVEAERLFRAWADSNTGWRVSVLRPSAVFGPENPATTNVYRLIEAVRTRRFVQVGGGQEKKTTSYIGNLLAATLFLLNRAGTGYRVFHYVDQPVLTTGQLVDRIYGLLGRRGPTIRVPLWLARPVALISDAVAAATGMDLPITSARIKKFCTPTNFSAAAIREEGLQPPFDHDIALRSTVAWHIEKDADDASHHRDAILSA